MNLRKMAKGRDCQIRLPGCRNDVETVVLAHYRMLPFCGTGIKPPDVLAAWACDYCHSIVDRRVESDFKHEYLRHAHAEGVMRTLAILADAGVLRKD